MASVVSVFKTDNMNMVQARDGFWLWDETRGMNLSWKAKTERDAFIEALEYYQDRLATVERQLAGTTAVLDAVRSLVSLENKDSDD